MLLGIPLADAQSALQDMAFKYHGLLELRKEREAMEGRGVYRLEGAERARRLEAMRATARRFPGALRELECSSAVLEGRHLAVLDLGRNEVPRGQWPDWLRVVELFHAAQTAFLDAKRRAGPAVDFAAFCEAWGRDGAETASLRLIWDPPGRKRSRAFAALIAESEALALAEVEAVLFDCKP